MKKFLAILLATVMCGSLCACGGATNEQATEKDTSVVKTTETETEAPTEPAPQFNAIETGDKIVLDFVEVEIGEIDHAPELKEDYTTYTPSNENNEFFWLKTKFVNLMGENASLYNSTFAQIVFDDKYTYEAEFHSFNGSEIAPLEENNIYIKAEVPPTILEKYKTVSVQIGINNNFEDFDYMKYDEEKIEYFDNLYEYTAKK